jgi:Membrane bound O-acyl transferase family
MPLWSSITLAVLSNACLAHLTSAFAWASVPPSRLMRYPFVLITLVFVHRAIISSRAIGNFGDQISTYLCGFALYSHYYLIVNRETAPPANSSLERLSNVGTFLFSPRKNLPARRIPSFSSSDLNYVPSRQAFLFAEIGRVLIGLIVLHYEGYLNLSTHASDYGPPHDRLLSRLFPFFLQNSEPDDKITVLECIIRAHTALATLISEYILHNLVYSSASILGVGLLFHSPSQWPPLYGPLKEAYTIRRFYGIFYHNLMRDAFIGNAAWIVDSFLLWVSHSTIISRIISSRIRDIRRGLINLVALVICGIMHSVAISTIDSCPRDSQMRYYLYIIIGMLTEDSMFWFFKRLHLRHLHWDRIGVYLRFWGYLWVFLFHCWMIPNSLYPEIYCDTKIQIAKHEAHLKLRNSRRTFDHAAT